MVFIGEAPGESEDVVGKCFVGPAGKLLQAMIDESIKQHGQYRYALTNIVGCVPRDGSAKANQPDEEDIKTCRPRLVEFIRMCKPRLIVEVGALAYKHRVSHDDVKAGEWLGKKTFMGYVDVTHPAAILRAESPKRPLMAKRNIARIVAALEEYL